MKIIMKNIRFFWWLVKESVVMDYLTIRRCKAILRKGALKFIFIKYSVIVKHLVKPYAEGDGVLCDGDYIFYDSRFGVAGYQRILTTHSYLLDCFNITDITTVVDVGANVGYFSLMCKKKYPGCCIYAFEPVPETYALLVKNFSRGEKIHSYQLALGLHAGKSHMHVDKVNKAESRISESGELLVNTVTLDEYLQDICSDEGSGLVDLLKIDVETFEASVLRGGRGMIAQTRFLFLEATFAGNKNYTISSLMSNLVSEVYDFQIIGYRNFSRNYDGPVAAMEMLLVNVKLENSFNEP